SRHQEVQSRCELRSPALVWMLWSGCGGEVRSAEHVAYLHVIIRKECLSLSLLGDEVLRRRLPRVGGREGRERGQYEKLTVLCRKILQRNTPRPLAHQCDHLLVQRVQLCEIHLWLHVRAKDDDDYRCAPVLLRTFPHQDPWLLQAPGGTTAASRPASAAAHSAVRCLLRCAGAPCRNVSHESCRECRRLTEREKMSARHLVSRDAETLTRHPSLERGWKEPIIAPHENAGWHGRPCLESAG